MAPDSKKKILLDVAVPRPDGLHDADLAKALEDGHDHGVDDAERGDDDGDHAHGGQDHVHEIEGLGDLVELVGQGERREAHLADPRS